MTGSSRRTLIVALVVLFGSPRSWALAGSSEAGRFESEYAVDARKLESRFDRVKGDFRLTLKIVTF